MFFRYKFECSQVLRTLRFIIKALYKESNKNFFGELLSLETLYEMLLSHSQFLNVILDTDGRSKTKGNILLAFAMSFFYCQYDLVKIKIVRNSIVVD